MHTFQYELLFLLMTVDMIGLFFSDLDFFDRPLHSYLELIGIIILIIFVHDLNDVLFCLRVHSL